jgi:hypothetical protein
MGCAADSVALKLRRCTVGEMQMAWCDGCGEMGTHQREQQPWEVGRGEDGEGWKTSTGKDVATLEHLQRLWIGQLSFMSGQMMMEIDLCKECLEKFEHYVKDFKRKRKEVPSVPGANYGKPQARGDGKGVQGDDPQLGHVGEGG